MTGTDVKSRLAKYNLTKAWLLNQLNKRQITISVTTFSLILSDSYTGKEKAAQVIAESMAILDKYETAMEMD